MSRSPATAVIFALLAFGLHVAASAAERPNILFILADDLGIDAMPIYGGQSYTTPNIDQLAGQGMRFDNAHANPYCTPSRAELLTGRYPFKSGMSRVIYDMQRHREFLDPAQHPSFARQLQQAGYRTAIAGKWQLSFLAERDTIRDFGFDTYMCWQIVTADNERRSRHYQPHFRKDGQIIADQIADRYGPDVLCEYLIDFMAEDRDGPFLAYYCSLLPHWPWIPTPDSKDQKMPASAANGQGDARFFPDSLAYLDKNVGRLLAALDEQGIADETIVIFTGDNGTDQRLTSRWNGLSVKGGKSSLNDRGTRVPLLVRWPGKVRAGGTDDRLVEFADFLPTLCELTGTPLPTEPIHGTSFAPRLLGTDGNANPKPWVHIERAGDRYLRSDQWIATNHGEFLKVQPYPHDPTPVDIEQVSDPQRQQLQHLQQSLQALDGREN